MRAGSGGGAFAATSSSRHRGEARPLGMVSGLLLFYLLCLRLQAALALHCLQPFVPENGHVIFNEPGPYAPKTVAKYSCALGFERVGREERICRVDGNWSGEPPICAIDVAHMKPVIQSTLDGASQPFKGHCTITEDHEHSWWEVDLLGSYSVAVVIIRIGTVSSAIERVESILDTGERTECEFSMVNSTVHASCTQTSVTRVRVTAMKRLQLCAAHVYATDAVSGWQCAQGSMDVIGVVDGLCLSASRDERSDWLTAQRKCLDRGGTLPMRIGETMKRGMVAALDGVSPGKDFFWIGASASTSEWRWVDGDPVIDDNSWPSSRRPTPGPGEAVVLSRSLHWKWLAASQSSWNPFLCQSKPKFCTSPGVGSASKVVFSSHSYAIGTFCFYTCDEGYHLVGDAQRECLETGRWSGSIPSCEKIDCGAPTQWVYGSIRLLNDSTLFLSEVEYMCNPGSQLQGDPTRICQSDGSWSGGEPICEELDCGRPPSIANGRVEVVQYSFDSTANYTCLEGFRLLGHETLTCGENALWEPSPPVCYDENALREIKGESGTLTLGVVAVILFIVLLIAVVWFARPTPKAPAADKTPVIYATPSVPPESVVYYASCAAVTQLEVPPHLLSLQHLPNGNIHVTIPAVTGRPMTRPSLPTFRPSPTLSQILYSFDHEPIYDTPPDVGTILRRSEEENVYERMCDTCRPPSADPPPPPPPPKNPPPAVPIRESK